MAWWLLNWARTSPYPQGVVCYLYWTVTSGFRYIGWLTGNYSKQGQEIFLMPAWHSAFFYEANWLTVLSHQMSSYHKKNFLENISFPTDMRMSKTTIRWIYKSQPLAPSSLQTEVSSCATSEPKPIPVSVAHGDFIFPCWSALRQEIIDNFSRHFQPRSVGRTKKKRACNFTFYDVNYWKRLVGKHLLFLKAENLLDW